MSAITLTGRLAEDAQNRSTTADGHVLLFVLSLPPASTGKPLLVRVRQHFGTGPAAALACRNKAHHLRRGTRVTVAGAAIGWTRGSAQLERLEYVHTPDIPTHRGTDQ